MLHERLIQLSKYQDKERNHGPRACYNIVDASIKLFLVNDNVYYAALYVVYVGVTYSRWPSPPHIYCTRGCGKVRSLGEESHELTGERWKGN